MKVDVNPTFHIQVDKTNLEINVSEMNWYVYPKLFKVGRFPLQLDIETNTICNIRCVKCFHSSQYIDPQRMPMGLIKKVIREGSYKGLESIKLQYRGEPLRYYGIEEAVRYAKQYGIKEVMFNTNATLLTREMIEKLVKAGLDKIICSIDSYEEELYEKLHRGAKFDVVVNNLLKLQDYKNINGRLRPILRVQKVVQQGNRHENNEKYIKFWEIIADQVAIEEFIDYNDNLERSMIMKDWACPQLWQRLFVWADGTVHPCCCLESDEVGDIHRDRDTIELIWGGGQMTRFRQLHQQGRSHEIEMCRKCPMRKHEYQKQRKVVFEEDTYVLGKPVEGGIGGGAAAWIYKSNIEVDWDKILKEAAKPEPKINPLKIKYEKDEEK